MKKLDDVEIDILNALARTSIFLGFWELTCEARINAATAGWYLPRMEEAGLVKIRRNPTRPDELEYHLGDNQDIPALLATAALDEILNGKGTQASHH